MDPHGPVCRNGEAVVCPTQASSFMDDPVTAPPGKRRGRTALLVGIGSTLLSVLGFGALTLFEQYNGLVSEMRNDLKHFNETIGEYVKRDSFQRFRDQSKERFKELQESNLAKYRLEQELKASEKARTETADELRRLRERLAYLEGRQAATAAVQAPASARKESAD